MHDDSVEGARRGRRPRDRDKVQAAPEQVAGSGTRSSSARPRRRRAAGGRVPAGAPDDRQSPRISRSPCESLADQNASLSTTPRALTRSSSSLASSSRVHSSWRHRQAAASPCRSTGSSVAPRGPEPRSMSRRTDPDGELDWDDVRGDFIEGAAVPPSLRQIVRVRAAVGRPHNRTQQRPAPSDPRFRDHVADLAPAPLHRPPRGQELVARTSACTGARYTSHAGRPRRSSSSAFSPRSPPIRRGPIRRNTARDRTSLATARRIGTTTHSALSLAASTSPRRAPPAEACARRPTNRGRGGASSPPSQLART